MFLLSILGKLVYLIHLKVCRACKLHDINKAFQHKHRLLIRYVNAQNRNVSFCNIVITVIKIVDALTLFKFLCKVFTFITQIDFP